MRKSTAKPTRFSWGVFLGMFAALAVCIVLVSDVVAAPRSKTRKSNKKVEVEESELEEVDAEAAAGESLDSDEDLGLVDENDVEVEEVDENAPLPQPMELSGQSFKTKDGVLLTATFYASNKGKKAVPVILLHGWEGTRKDFAVLAPYLQKEGYAVLVPDLRGHGDSMKKEIAPEKYTELKAPRFSASVFNEMVIYDMACLKNFLKQENNRGRLNANKICILGIEEGALLASTFASRDWSIPKSDKIDRELGDVLAVGMISTPKNAKKLKFEGTLMKVSGWNKVMSYLFLTGQVEKKDRKVEKVATLRKNVEDHMKVFYGRDKDALKQAMENIFEVELDVKLQGAKLIAEDGSEALKLILNFFEKRGKLRDILWEKRIK